MQKQNQKSKKRTELRLEVFKLKNTVTEALRLMNELLKGMNLLRFMSARNAAVIEILKEKGIITDDEINSKIQEAINKNADSNNPTGGTVQPEGTIGGDEDNSGDSKIESPVLARQNNGNDESIESKQS